MGVLNEWVYGLNVCNTLGILRLALRGVASRRRLEVPTGESEYDTRMSSTHRSRHDCKINTKAARVMLRTPAGGEKGNGWVSYTR